MRDYDDAYVAYINGVEVGRSNIGAVGFEPPSGAAAADFMKRPGTMEVIQTMYSYRKMILKIT